MSSAKTIILTLASVLLVYLPIARLVTIEADIVFSRIPAETWTEIILSLVLTTIIAYLTVIELIPKLTVAIFRAIVALEDRNILNYESQ